MSRFPFIWLGLLLCWSGAALHAQSPDDRRQLEAFRVAFFTRQLDLSSEEAQRFWPVFNQFTQAKNDLNREENRLQQRMRNAYDGDDETKLAALSDAYIAIQKRKYELRAEYHDEFKKVLPIRKVVRLYKAENEFRRELLEEIRRRRLKRRNE